MDTPPNLPFSPGAADSDAEAQYGPRALWLSNSWMLESARARGRVWQRSWPGGSGGGARRPQRCPCACQPVPLTVDQGRSYSLGGCSDCQTVPSDCDAADKSAAWLSEWAVLSLSCTALSLCLPVAKNSDTSDVSALWTPTVAQDPALKHGFPVNSRAAAPVRWGSVQSGTCKVPRSHAPLSRPYSRSHRTNVLPRHRRPSHLPGEPRHQKVPR